MSRTRTVPDAVPLLFHSSRFLTPSSALKKTVPPTLIRNRGSPLTVPGLMSFTRTVPEAVPLLFQSSLPLPEDDVRSLGSKAARRLQSRDDRLLGEDREVQALSCSCAMQGMRKIPTHATSPLITTHDVNKTQRCSTTPGKRL